MARIRKLDTTSLVGKVFSDLTVLYRADPKDFKVRKYTPWICRCVCGKEVKSSAGHLRCGEMKSCGCSRNADLEEGPFKILFSRYKSHARSKGRSFALTEDEFRGLVKSNCHYCDREPLQRTVKKGKLGEGAFLYNGLDRIDSSLGYSITNAIPCCAQCNRAKSDMSYSEFKAWIQQVSSNWATK